MTKAIIGASIAFMVAMGTQTARGGDRGHSADAAAQELESAQIRPRASAILRTSPRFYYEFM